MGGVAPRLLPFPGSHLNSTAVINTLICSALMNSNPHYVLSKWAFTSPVCGLGRCTDALARDGCWVPLVKAWGGQPRSSREVYRGTDNLEGTVQTLAP